MIRSWLLLAGVFLWKLLAAIGWLLWRRRWVEKQSTGSL
jgi:hypothetical protein